MATFCMQSLGCKVSAIHTVNYSEITQGGITARLKDLL